MFFIFSAYLLANVSVVSHASTTIEGTGSTYTKIQTTVNGNTTTVESNEPGAISVVKTDEGEHITAGPAVTITHSQTTIEPTPQLRETPHATVSPALQNRNYWTSLLRTLWDRVKNILSFGLLTRK